MDVYYIAVIVVLLFVLGWHIGAVSALKTRVKLQSKIIEALGSIMKDIIEDKIEIEVEHDEDCECDKKLEKDLPGVKGAHQSDCKELHKKMDEHKKK